MAAPTGTVWGDIIKGTKNPSGQQGRIGIYVNVSNTNTKTTVNVQVWFKTIYSCSDGTNNFYYNAGTSVNAATTKIGSVSISHTVDTGDPWNTSNQTKLLDKTYEYTRDVSAKTYKVYAKYNGIDMLSGTMYANTSYTVPALTKYTVSYNANGGSGAPGAQTKWYGKDLILSSTKPTRTGYSFQGWALSEADADEGTWYYKAGGTCGKNENLTLYAVWKANTYTVSYNANGGSGAPAAQTKTYGVTLKLASAIPTRENYNFLGWGTAATATKVSYAPGANYTANAAVTLYAIWELAYVKPRISGVSVYRCTEDGTVDDSGTYARVIFDWATDQAVSSILVEHFVKDTDIVTTTIFPPEPEPDTDTEATAESESDTEPEPHTEGHVDVVIGSGDFSTDKTYTIRMTVADAIGYLTLVRTINGYAFVRDFYAQGKGVAWGKPAELENVFDIGFRTRLLGGLLYVLLPPETDLNDIRTPGFYVGENVSDYQYVNCPLASGTFTLEVLSGGDNGQTLQRLTRCSKNEPMVFERTFYAKEWSEWTGGWITATLSSSFGAYNGNSSYNPKYRKDGRIVEIRGIVTPTDDLEFSTEHITIFTLPSGYRPDIPLYILCQGTGNCTWLLRVNTDGTVGFARYRNGDTNTTAKPDNWLPFQVTYFAK